MAHPACWFSSVAAIHALPAAALAGLLPLVLLGMASRVMAAHTLMDYQGVVTVQRKQSDGWAAPQPVRRRGLPLVSRDRLEVRSGAEALVRCASAGRRLWMVEIGGPFPVSRGCGSEMTLRQAPLPQALAGGSAATLPYLIAPRATSVAAAPIPLQWHPVAGVRGYQVWLLRQRDQRLLWGARVVGASSIDLPASLALTPTERYLVVVEADDGSSSVLDSPLAQQGFRLATAEELADLERQRRALPLATLDAEAAALLQADLLRQYDLMQQAITLLEQHLRLQGPRLAVLLELGRLYGSVGLNRLAWERFEQAGLLAGSSGDPEALAEASSGAAEARRRAQGPTP